MIHEKAPETMNTEQFESQGTQYSVDNLGIVHQLNPKPYVYDKEYVSTYDKPEYKELSKRISATRLALIVGAFGRVPDSILDFGYGDGSFLKYSKQLVENCYGYDITELDVPAKCIRIEDYLNSEVDVITFWDALEHCPDISFVKYLKCKMIAVSLPNCHGYNSEWFDNWKHRKPDEHLHHFNKSALERFFVEYGWRLVSISNIEDTVRAPIDEKENIITGCFVRAY